MNDPSRDEFLVRFYRWAFSDALREIKEDCPLIKSVRGTAASIFIEYIDSFSKEQRADLIKALVKRMHRPALELCNESLDEHEQGLIDAYLSGAREISGRYVDQFVFTLGKKASKRKLRTLVTQEILGVCGPIVNRDSNDLWDHAQPIEGWKVLTEIDLGGRARLRYGHYIQGPVEQSGNLNGVGFIRLLEWMGISSGTEWNLLCEGEEEEAATSLKRICAHFMNALPPLLEGIE